MSSSSSIGGSGGGGGTAVPSVSSMNNNHFGSPHSDVLSVIINDTTSTPEQRETLYIELQRRSKAAVQAKQWYDAITLYTKAIECCSTSIDGIGNTNVATTTTASTTTTATTTTSYLHTLPLTKATLYANISLCFGKMNRWTEAVTNAQESVNIETTYMKGWYRLGQALVMEKDYISATSAFEKAITLDPNNTVLQKEFEKCKLLYDTQINEDATTKIDVSKDAIITTTTSSKTIPTTTTTTTKVVVTNDDNDVDMKVMNLKSSVSNPDNDDETTTNNNNEDGFTKSDHIRGYKIVNGKKTSYFHNELSEETKQLIGDIAPKKLDPNTINTATSTSTGTTNTDKDGKSVWNKAGTWEEKDCTAWAIESMTNLFTNKSYTLPISSPAPNAIVSISKIVIDSNSTHASFATVRTKKRYIYEFDITIYWNFIHNDNISTTASGTIQFPDIDGTTTCNDGYEATNFMITHMDDSTLQPVLTQFIYNQGLRYIIHETIDQWVQLFKDTY